MKIPEWVRKPTLLEVIALLVGIALVCVEPYAIKEGWYRYFTVGSTAAAALATVLLVKEQRQRLAKAKVKAKDGLERATLKVEAEILAGVALVGFVFNQFAVGLRLDEFMTGRTITVGLEWLVFQSSAQKLLVLCAALAISRKIALALFERDALPVTQVPATSEQTATSAVDAGPAA